MLASPMCFSAHLITWGDGEKSPARLRACPILPSPHRVGHDAHRLPQHLRVVQQLRQLRVALDQLWGGAVCSGVVEGGQDAAALRRFSTHTS
jgi:hypothetical protein